MRIESTRVLHTGEVQRVGERERAPAANPSGRLEETTDLLALSSGVRVARQRDVEVSQLREAYRSGALQPDAERIAARLLSWGFEIGRGEGL